MQIEGKHTLAFASVDSLEGYIDVGEDRKIEFVSGYIPLGSCEKCIIDLNDSTEKCVKSFMKSIINDDIVYVIVAFDPTSKSQLFEAERYNGIQLILSNPSQLQKQSFESMYKSIYK